jgi:hypothetical protein
MMRLFAALALAAASLTGQGALAAPTCSEPYVVEPGDSLARIAERAYQDRSLWRYIYQYRANGEAIGRRPGRLAVGTRLELPPCQRIAAPRPTPPDEDVAARPSETGGPLIRLPSEEAGDGSIQDLVMVRPTGRDDGAGGTTATPDLTVTAESAREGDKALYFHLELSAPPAHSLVILYTVLAGSASAAEDFKHRQGVMVFEPGQQRVALAVELIDDETTEEAETLSLFLSGDPNIGAIAERTLVASLEDDDG